MTDKSATTRCLIRSLFEYKALGIEITFELGKLIALDS